MTQENLVSEFLENNFDIEPVKFRINLFNSVRDFIYQINLAFSPEKLLELKEGYCGAKHRLLKICYEKLGYEVKLCYIPFSFSMINLPQKLKDRGFSEKKGYHIFLKLKINNKWIDIDATWNKELKDIFIVNLDWDGISTQKVLCSYNEIYYPRNEQEETEIKQKLSDTTPFTDDDKKWINEFNKYIKSSSLEN